MVLRTGDNNFATAKWIVDPTVGLGTHTTIASALTSASSGETIFVRPGTYTENITLKAGVDIVSYIGDSDTPNVTIVGKCTATFAGTCSLSGIRLQTNSDFCLVVSGSSATIINIRNCFINASNNTAISFTSSSSSAYIYLIDTNGDLGTTGIAYISSSSAGTIYILKGRYRNTGNSLTNSTLSSGALDINYAIFSNPVTTSGTAAFNSTYSRYQFSGLNITALTHGGSGSSAVRSCEFVSDTASAISISGTLAVVDCTFNSSNTNTITGAGTVLYGNNVQYNTSNLTINTTTQTPYQTRYGIQRSSLQPAFLAYRSANVTNVTGNGATYTGIFDTEVFDQNSNYNNATGVFTAPVTGLYQFNLNIVLRNIGAGMTTGIVNIVATGSSFRFNEFNPITTVAGSGNIGIQGSALVNMTAGDTASVTIFISGGAGNTVTFGGQATLRETSFSGYLVC
jgi:hypothetical protein